MTLGPSQQAETAVDSTSVIVCTFDERRLEGLQRCLEAIRLQVPTPLEIFVVVNDNPTLARSIAELIDGIKILENARPGVSHARDLGSSAATADLLAFVDDDAVPHPGWLAALIEPFDDGNVMMTSGYIEPLWATKRPRWFPDEFLWVVGCSYRGLPGNGATLRNPIGASMAIRRSVVEATGSFESNLGRIGTDGSGCEETEFAIRAHRLQPGGTVIHVTESIVDHTVPARRTSLTYFLRRCWREGRSKAILVELSSPGEGLSTERVFVRSTILIGLSANLRRPWHWDRFGMIVIGLGATGAGYVIGRLALRLEHRMPVPRSDDQG